MPNSAQLSVALVEPDALFRELATKAFSEHEDVFLSWSAPGAREARELFSAHSVDVLVTELDLENGNGIGLALSLRKINPTLGIVLILDEMFTDNLSALDGVNLTGIRVILRGEISGLRQLVSEIYAASQGLGRNVAHYLSSDKTHLALSELTSRQYEVLRELAAGLANPEIARTLGIQVSSVVNHLTAIYNTLGIPKEANPRVYATLIFLGKIPESRVGA